MCKYVKVNYSQKRHRLELLLKIAEMYWRQQMSQEAIARQLRFSRSHISRMLTEARQEGVVQIRIASPRAFALEKKFLDNFGLQKIIITESETNKIFLQASAELITELIKPRTVLALSNGVTLAAVVHEMIRKHKKHGKKDTLVAQLIGSLGPENRMVDSSELCRELANFLGGNFHTVSAPLVLSSASSVNALRHEPMISTTFALASHADMALVGIGLVTPQTSGKIFDGWVDEKAAAKIHAAGAVGHIAAHHYDINGNPVETEISRRVLSISLKDVKKIPQVVAVAHGKEKAQAILGALRGGYVDILTIDADTAQLVLSFAGISA